MNWKTALSNRLTNRNTIMHVYVNSAMKFVRILNIMSWIMETWYALFPHLTSGWSTGFLTSDNNKPTQIAKHILAQICVHSFPSPETDSSECLWKVTCLVANWYKSGDANRRRFGAKLRLEAWSLGCFDASQREIGTLLMWKLTH